MGNTWRKWLAGLLAMAMLFAMLPTTVVAADVPQTSVKNAALDAKAPEDNWDGVPYGVSSATEYNLSDGSLVISEDCAYIVSGDTTVNNIVVTGGNVVLTLNGVQVENENCAFDIQGGTVTLILDGDTVNSFSSGNCYAGIHVAEDASLTISGTGVLNATSHRPTGGSYPSISGAGIGGNGGSDSNQAPRDNAGSITITGGTINATSEGDGAGIGGGWTDQGSRPMCGGFQSIRITGGTVYAKSNSNGAGIG